MSRSFYQLQATTQLHAGWPFKPLTGPASDILKPFADLAADTLLKCISTTTCTGTITGGAAPPGGPVVGAVCLYTAGSVVLPPLQLSSLFKHATITSKLDDGRVFTSSTPTPWMEKYVSVFLDVYESAVLDWFTKWQGTTTAYGGVAGWIPSPPPAPGPWVGGTVAPLPLASGVSSSMKIITLADDFIRALKSTSITLDVQGTKYTRTMCETTQAEAMSMAIASSVAHAFIAATATVSIVDETGAAASGTAAPGGVIVAGTVPTTLSDNS